MTYHSSASSIAETIARPHKERDWYRTGIHYTENPGGPDHDIRVIATGKLYRVPDFTYTRLVKHNAAPDPEGWLEITEDGEPVEYPEDDAACSRSDASYQFCKENSND